MANPVITNLDGSNPGPAGISTVNTQTPYSTLQFVQTIAVTLTPTQIATATSTEQSYGLNGVTFVSAATGIKAGDVIIGISPPSTVTGVALGGFRNDGTVNDKFYITWQTDSTTLTPPSGVYAITVARYNLSNASTLPSALA